MLKMRKLLNENNIDSVIQPIIDYRITSLQQQIKDIKSRPNRLKKLISDFESKIQKPIKVKKYSGNEYHAELQKFMLEIIIDDPKANVDNFIKIFKEINLKYHIRIISYDNYFGQGPTILISLDSDD